MMFEGGGMIIEWLAEKWAVNDPLPEKCDLLVPIAHGATKDRLTRGAEAVARKTTTAVTELRDRYQLPFVAFGAFTGSENPELERALKLKHFSGKYVGTVMSTIEECLKVRANLPIFVTVSNIVVVTDEAHSRRCRIVWKTFFPNAKVSILSVKITETVDPESPMEAYDKAWKVLFFQAVPTPLWWLLSLFGQKCLGRLEKLHTPLSK
ncbi:MAG: hypothetical protein AB198_00630 [Parcubacteria bacterium C7867-003]|nr:MAG: hypothetical protein AB198_00630 [Parcubacteria bacterium C7867-003]